MINNFLILTVNEYIELSDSVICQLLIDLRCNKIFAAIACVLYVIKIA